ncbi:MAG: LPS-assembly protein LptD, partial [Candidatus Marinimicrobia bacterium]|nr:LPS-assembly protein LptD [Candidatus Neomarinimicrobiota bacterium]
MNHVTKDDSSYIHLRKDVRFKKGNIFIHSEEAFNYEEDNLLLLKNNVHIQDGNKEFFGEQVFYDTETDQIRIPDKSQMIFEGKSLQAGIIRANLENDIITAIGEVVVSDSGTIIHCDTLTYFEKEKEAHIQGKGHIRDKKEKISLLSDLFYYNLDTEHIFSGLPAQIIQQDSLGKDVFTLDAGFISAFMEDKRFIAEDSVVIFQDSLQAFCDSFYYASLEDRGSLHKNPLIVQKENKISGTDMYLLFNEKSIDHVDIIGNARTENIQIGYLKRDSIETPIPKISHLTGLRLLVQLEDNELSTLRMQGMAASDYHVFEDSVYQGLNASSGDTVVMDFKDGELKEIAILEGARGTYYPNQEAVSMDTTIVYSSDRIFYRIDNRQTRLVKNAGLIFGEMTLRADTIMVNWNTNMLLALPEITDTGLVHLPEMEQKGDNPLVGEKLEYNLKTRRGKITQGKTKLDDGYYQGEKILNRSKDAFFVKDGRYSTCDRPEPHFWIESRYMKMIPKDKVFARPLILKIQGIPIFALPFGFFPTKGGGRQSGWLMPSYGYRSASGRFLKDGGYYWAPNDYFDTRFTMNFYDKWGILSSLNTRYVLRYKLNGTIAVKYKKYFIDQHSTSYDINIRHSQTIGKSSRLNVSGSYTNDRSFYNTTGITLDERLKQKLISNATYSTRIGALSFQSNLSRTEDLVSGNVNATLPNISISKGSAPLFKASSSSAKKWYNNFTYNTGSRFSNTYSHILQSDSSYVDNTKNGIISSASLKYSGKAFKWLSLSPSVNYKDGLVFKYNAPVLENGQLTYNDDGS